MQVSIADVTPHTKMFSLAGPESSIVLEGLGATAPASNQVALIGFQNSPVVVAAGSGLSGPGYTLVADELAAGELWRSLTIKAGIAFTHRTVVCHGIDMLTAVLEVSSCIHATVSFSLVSWQLRLQLLTPFVGVKQDCSILDSFNLTAIFCSLGISIPTNPLENIESAPKHAQEQSNHATGRVCLCRTCTI